MSFSGIEAVSQTSVIQGVNNSVTMQSWSVIAESMNKVYIELMALTQILSTGKLTEELAEMYLKSNGKTGGIHEAVEDFVGRMKELGITIDSEDPTATGTGDNTEVENYQSLMENPGMLFMLQNIMSQMKEAMGTLNTAGQTIGQAISTAHQQFQRGLS